MPGSRVPLHEVAADDLLHDFDRTATDTDHSGIDEGPRYGIFAHVAIATKELQALVCCLALQLGRDQLQLGSQHRIQRMLEVTLYAPVCEHSRRCRLRVELGQHELRILKIRDRAAERLAVTDVARRPIDDSFAYCDTS